MKGKLAIKTYLREVKGLGEFMCVFKKNSVCPEQSKYFVEVYWNFIGWSDGINFEIGYPVNDINKEIEKYESDEGLKDFIFHAKITSECKLIERASISLGAYEDLLRDYFNYTDEQINYLYEEGIVEDTFDEEEMDIFFDIFNGILYSEEIKPKSFLINMLEDKGLDEMLEKVLSLNDLESEILLKNIYNYLEESKRNMEDI